MKKVIQFEDTQERFVRYPNYDGYFLEENFSGENTENNWRSPDLNFYDYFRDFVDRFVEVKLQLQAKDTEIKNLKDWLEAYKESVEIATTEIESLKEQLKCTAIDDLGCTEQSNCGLMQVRFNKQNELIETLKTENERLGAEIIVKDLAIDNIIHKNYSPKDWQDIKHEALERARYQLEQATGEETNQ